MSWALKRKISIDFLDFAKLSKETCVMTRFRNSIYEIMRTMHRNQLDNITMPGSELPKSEQLCKDIVQIVSMSKNSERLDGYWGTPDCWTIPDPDLWDAFICLWSIETESLEIAASQGLRRHYHKKGEFFMWLEPNRHQPMMKDSFLESLGKASPRDKFFEEAWYDSRLGIDIPEEWLDQEYNRWVHASDIWVDDNKKEAWINHWKDAKRKQAEYAGTIEGPADWNENHLQLWDDIEKQRKVNNEE